MALDGSRLAHDLQWGSASASASSDTYIAYPILFLNGCLSISLTQAFNSGTTPTSYGIATSAIGNKFGVNVRYAAGSTNAFYYIAVGK